MINGSLLSALIIGLQVKIFPHATKITICLNQMKIDRFFVNIIVKRGKNGKKDRSLNHRGGRDFLGGQLIFEKSADGQLTIYGTKIDNKASINRFFKAFRGKIILKIIPGRGPILACGPGRISAMVRRSRQF